MPAGVARLVYHRGMRTTAVASALVLPVVSSVMLLLSACASTGDGVETEAPDMQETAAATSQATEVKAASDAASTPLPPERLLEEVDKAFEARRESFRRVNSARMSQHAGRFDVTMTFAATGEVVECRMLSTEFRDDPAFNAAVMAEVWRLRIPPRPGAGEFVVSSYPIAFSARSEAAAAVAPAPPVAP